MSGLEAFGLVCNVLTVITFTRDTITLCKAVYHGDSPDAQLSSTALTLQTISAEVESHFNTISAQTACEKRLVDIAKKCHDAATKLEDEIGFITDNIKSGSLTATLRVAVKTNWRRKRLDRLEGIVERCKNELETSLLARVFATFDAIKLQQTEEFKNTNSQLKLLVQQYASGNQRIDHLIQTINSTRGQAAQEISRAEQAIKSHLEVHMTESKKSTESCVALNIGQATTNITKSVQEASTRDQSEQHAEQRKERLLGSFKFPAMNERRNQITDVPGGSFEAVFQAKPADSSDKYSDWTESDSDIEIMSISTATSTQDAHIKGKRSKFSSWLQSDERLFWITGKPGSGKSTLAKYLLSTSKTWDALRQWDTECQMISHFFWKPGSDIQKNVKGLLCSLLHQVLSLNVSLVETILEGHWNTADKDSHTDWSIRSLKELFVSVLVMGVRPLCILIDGIDEVSGVDSPADVLTIIDAIKNLPKVKVCATSRPEPCFRLHLYEYPHIQVHELTAADMWEFSNKVLPELFGTSDAVGTALIECLVLKAEGVFLWLSLAIQNLKYGLKSQDTESELLQRLEDLPADLSDMFAEMWTRVNGSSSVYRHKAALYLNLMLHDSIHGVDQTLRSYRLAESRSMSLFLMMAATELCLSHASASDDAAMTENQLEDFCRDGSKQIEKRCAGLIEMVPVGENFFLVREYLKSGTPDKRLNRLLSALSWTNRTVRFIHRTVYDFLLYSEKGQHIRQADTSTEEEHSYQLIVGLLVSFRYGVDFMRNQAEETIESLNLIRDPRLRYSLFKSCQFLYENRYLDRPQSDEGICFLALAASTSCNDFILDELARSDDPSGVATIVLTDILQAGNRLSFELSSSLIKLGGNPNTPRLHTRELLDEVTYCVSDSALGRYLEEMFHMLHQQDYAEAESHVEWEYSLQVLMRFKPNLTMSKSLRVCLGHDREGSTPQPPTLLLSMGTTCPSYPNTATTFGHMEGLWTIESVFVLTVNLAFLVEAVIRLAVQRNIQGLPHLNSRRAEAYADILANGISCVDLKLIIGPPAVGYKVLDDAASADILATIVPWLLGGTTNEAPHVPLPPSPTLERVDDEDLPELLTEPLFQLDSPGDHEGSGVPEPYGYLFQESSAYQHFDST